MKPIYVAVSTREAGFARAIARGLSEKGEGFFVQVLEREAVRAAAAAAAAKAAEIAAAAEIGGNVEIAAHAEIAAAAETAARTGINAAAEVIGTGHGLNWQILVTDLCCQEGLIVPEVWMDRVIRLEGYVISVKDVLDRIMDVACNLGIGSAGGLGGKTSGRPFVVGFFGRHGGSGVTSVALTTGRMLAGAFGERVLYLSFAPEDDAYLYGAGAQAGPSVLSGERPGRPGGRPCGLRTAQEHMTGEGRVGAQAGSAAGAPAALKGLGGRGRSRKELLYRLRQGMPFYFEQYAVEDVYGLACLKPTAGANCFHLLVSDERRSLVEQIVKVTDYDVILVDLGAEPNPAQDWQKSCFHLLTEVRSRVDQRCLTDESEEDAVVIWNHGPASGRSEVGRGGLACGEGGRSGIVHGEVDPSEDDRGRDARFEIAHDPESFCMGDGADQTEKWTEDGGSISIDMTKDFAIGIKNFSNFLEDFVLKAR